jgi:uncharacterized protein YraI
MYTLFFVTSDPSRFLPLTIGKQTDQLLKKRLSFSFVILSCVLIFLAACGPEKSVKSEEKLIAETMRIAQEYHQTGDINRARVQLETLSVANSTQWLIYLTETSIAENHDANAIAALVRLSMNLGLHSAAVSLYAAQHGLSSGGDSTANPPSNPSGTINVSVSDTSQPFQATGAGSAQIPRQSQAEEATATFTPQPLILAPTPTETPVPKPVAQASNPMNVRSGPSTDYLIVGSLQPNQEVDIVGKSSEGDWWQVVLPNGQTGWIYGELTATTGNTADVAVAANIPPPPPTATLEPVVAPAPVQQGPPPSDKPHFTLIERRLWNKDENDGCKGKHLLRIHVFDANGNRLNGVALQGIYTGEILVTGSQGKGDGVIEYDLYGSGEGFIVIRDVDGREVASDRAEGFTTRSVDIDEATLIGAGYCSNSADCQVFYNSYGCHGHHSWEAKLKRNY